MVAFFFPFLVCPFPSRQERLPALFSCFFSGPVYSVGRFVYRFLILVVVVVESGQAASFLPQIKFSDAFHSAVFLRPFPFFLLFASLTKAPSALSEPPPLFLPSAFFWGNDFFSHLLIYPADHAHPLSLFCTFIYPFFTQVKFFHFGLTTWFFPILAVSSVSEVSLLIFFFGILSSLSCQLHSGHGMGPARRFTTCLCDFLSLPPCLFLPFPFFCLRVLLFGFGEATLTPSLKSCLFLVSEVILLVD